MVVDTPPRDQTPENHLLTKNQKIPHNQNILIKKDPQDLPLIILIEEERNPSQPYMLEVWLLSAKKLH